MTMDFSKLTKEIKPQIRVALENPNVVNTKKATHKHITVKSMKNKEK